MGCSILNRGERCVNLISDTVAMIPIKLYKEEMVNGKRKTVEVEDSRCDLFNYDTKDTLDGVQFKKALVRDYLLDGNAYAYINKRRNLVKSLHYVDCDYVLINQNFDPIFKDYNIMVYGKTYKPYEFLKILIPMTKITLYSQKTDYNIKEKSMLNYLLAFLINTKIKHEIIYNRIANKNYDEKDIDTLISFIYNWHFII